jgi:hypothetical protein
MRNLGALISGLSLAASPTFALLALHEVMRGDDALHLLCAGAGLGGMRLMYGLMAMFHLGSWLRLLQSRALPR